MEDLIGITDKNFYDWLIVFNAFNVFLNKILNVKWLIKFHNVWELAFYKGGLLYGEGGFEKEKFKIETVELIGVN